MKRNLWLSFGFAIIIIALAVVIDLPKSFFWGDKIKAQLGLDLVGGTELVYQADLSSSKDNLKDLNNLSSVFRQRIDSLGVSEPSIQTSGTDKIIIELPGVKDIDQAVNQIGQTYDMIFMVQGTAEDGVTLKDYYDNSYVYPGYWKATDLTGRNLLKSDYTFENSSTGTNANQPVVTIKFDNTGTAKFKTLTTDNLNKQIAIVLDNKIVSAPNVSVVISNGEAIITGSKDIKEAQLLAKRLNEGILPVPAKLVAQQNIGATLGQDSLKKSIVAGIIGLLLVIIFMISYYKFSGLIASGSLIAYTLIALSLYKLIPVTLTLAGIAGFILSIGMAIDANVLIFERFREELKTGKETTLALKDGFKRSWSSIRDSNMSSLITCAILYFTAGSGPVRGFALTLGLGILVSLFTAVTLTRTVMLIIANTKAKGLINA
ncbi:MAG: protein translocase subunit SecD [Candidatus Berkelbacteria bacterium]